MPHRLDIGMIKVKPVPINEPLLDIVNNWRAIQKLVPLPRDWLPSMVFVAHEEYGPIAICSLFMSPGSVRAVVDDLHVDPMALPEIKDQAIFALVNVCEQMATGMGMRYIDAFTFIENVAARAMHMGYGMEEDKTYVRVHKQLAQSAEAPSPIINLPIERRIIL